MSDSIAPAPPATPPAQSGLLACCLYLAKVLDESGLEAALSVLHEAAGAADRKQLFQQVLAAARQAGLRPQVARLNQEQLAGLASRLPVIVELKNGSYQVLIGMNRSSGQLSLLVPGIATPDAPGAQEEQVSLEEFRQEWTGGLLFFEQINTALICFSLIAREHKIELTQDRLVHEYGLNRQEIPKNTLLRIAKDHGLQAKALRMSWPDLAKLKKAWPALARLKNGRHVVLTGLKLKYTVILRMRFQMVHSLLTLNVLMI